MNSNKTKISILYDFMKIAAFISVAYLTTFYSYMLFHSLVEVFYVLVALIIFVIVWNSRKFIDNNFYIFLGIAFLFIGFINLMHLFTFKGVFLFDSGSLDLSSQLWLSAQYMTSFSFLAALFFVKRPIRPYLTFIIFLIISLLLLFLIFSHRFPATFDQFAEPTDFKIFSELFIFIISAISLGLLLKNKNNFDNRVKGLLSFSIIAGIGSEIGIIVWNEFDLVGHFLKVFSFSFLYLGIVETIIVRPFRILFKNLKDSEVALRDSEERYRTLVELSPNAIFLHADNKIVYANHASLQLFGASSESEIVGRNIVEFFPPSQSPKIAERIKNLKSGSLKQSVIETKIKNLKGKTIPVEASGALINFGGGIAIQSVLRDITQQKANEKKFRAYTAEIEKIAEDLKKFKLAVENASDAIYITSPSLEVIYANAAAEKITGYKRNEILGETPMLWRDPAISDNEVDGFIRKFKKELENKNQLHYEVANRSKQGRKYISSLSISQ
ncbi:MAG: PAS domain S-box, partial [Candidatus Falkowbacteria bacterium GW2011_GWF2_39_8]